uniref:Sushi domain containing 2 n=1 Tax=Denticeps clupeoides TaxID=299321 RepID=A0AAY4B758_9TELE
GTDKNMTWILFLVIIKSQMCEGQCGQKLLTCSCHATCVSLENCCEDFKDFCVDISPYSGSMFGGTDFVVLGVSFNNISNIFCRFKKEIVTEGYVDDEKRGHCTSPLLYETGWIPFEIFTNKGLNNSRQGAWLSVHTGKLDSKLKVQLENATKWQYYGTPNTGGSLKMTWNVSLVRAEAVNLELWGYREQGVPYSDSWKAEWTYLYSLERGHPNNGTFTFIPKVAEKPYSDWELGAIRVSSSTYPDGASNVNAAWSEDHALAWHLEESYREDSAAWALKKCVTWDQLEKTLPNFLSETIDCPCTLAQARADTGRFHTDYGCDLEKGSVCTYHPGSVHCVRAIQASSEYAAGQQCCYDSTGAQVLTFDSIGGSTPDRGHDWGSPPYKKPPRVPGSSHWVYDVLSFYYCCLWSENCHYYFTHRPSSDCRTYKPPKAGFVFGDPHFITFDNVSYTFNGKGEYSLVVAAEKGLLVQGRTEQLTEPLAVNATKLSAVAMKEGNSDVIEVRLSRLFSSLEVLRNQAPLSFSEQTWMDLDGKAVFSYLCNVTVMFPSGAGVEVRLRERTIVVTVLLPEDFRNSVEGLLGNMNDDPTDDLISRDKEIFLANSNAEELFSFGASWAILNESSLFTYDSAFLLDTYFYAPKHNPYFRPVFELPIMCSGKGSQFCKYDTLVSRSADLGNATRHSFNSHMSVVVALEPVVSCGWIPPPKNGKKEGTTYLQGSTLTFSCDAGYTLQGAAERKCQSDGRWSGDSLECVAGKKELTTAKNTFSVLL